MVVSFALVVKAVAVDPSFQGQLMIVAGLKGTFVPEVHPPFGGLPFSLQIRDRIGRVSVTVRIRPDEIFGRHKDKSRPTRIDLIYINADGEMRT